MTNTHNENVLNNQQQALRDHVVQNIKSTMTADELQRVSRKAQAKFNMMRELTDRFVHNFAIPGPSEEAKQAAEFMCRRAFNVNLLAYRPLAMLYGIKAFSL